MVRESGGEDLLVIKEDCINHVTKRVMKHLMKLKQEKTQRIPATTTTMKSSTSLSSSKKQPARQQQLLDDNKKWGDGVGRMTTSMMDKLSTSYGIAIRQASSLSCGKKYN
ncbi:unnamed protein product [Didymodactylos carnosus]|uniref:Uncharacterized protein n=1 Tax=Didymodactylos carnosus TaxID=1234261 RepID=A0A815X9R6_9BILA|nr:unnamed protein product [Didymodactylos carnosus]CAF4415858.1 unnamed protein product [Didymodactylos carnosus]